MKHRFFKFLATSFAVLGFAACASTPNSVTLSQNCQGFNWWDIGHSEGRIGAGAEKLSQWQERCATTANPVQLDSYQNGYDAGLVELCSQAQAFTAGRNGLPTSQRLCPAPLASAYAKSYALGSRARALAIENQEIENQIRLLAEPNSSADSKLTTKLVEKWRTKKSRNQQEISTIERSQNWRL
jgi:hypothetical protein